MRVWVSTLGVLVFTEPASAQVVEMRPLIETRARYEHLDQADLALASDAVTIRVRAGVEVSQGPWSALGEAQGNLAIVGNYNDGLNGLANRPTIGDPENIAIYRAQLQYRTKPLTITGGRQRIALDDERFVGNAQIRNNAQTFDAVRAEIVPLNGLKLDLTYAWDVRTIWGTDGRGVRQRGVGGNNVFFNAGAATPLGTLTGFAYVVDQDEAEVQGFRLSSQSYGLRLVGSRPIAPQAKLGYQFSWAGQSDYHHNPMRYHAQYWLADATLELRSWKLNAGYEVLGADSGVALTSFQTPLGALFKFQGWIDKLTVTPPNGVRDLYVGAGYGWKAVGRIDAVTLQAVLHRYRSDRLDQHYGDELNLLATAKMKKALLSLRYAHYEADRFSSDANRYWLQLDWTY
ncbi:alginate export family protein [Sphingomonas sp. TDK1]|uniref:alginate export family protein n=1 Tax=Sphingomonas sp. TDK1 TaxID=453247 RepID=UPI0007D98AB8|nr:alginate export family protein [Sphingomonas sp. TDK1]OAN67108.1 hypothetical protein A7X12_00295 [Sphingomonas sp. TDK1]